MRTVKYRYLVVLVALGGIAPISCCEQMSAEPPKTDDSVIQVAGKEYSLLFECNDLSTEVRNAIAADIALNLSLLKHVTFRPIHKAQAEKYQETVTHWWPSKARMNSGFPEVMRRYFGGAVKVGNEYKLVIHEKLIQAYEEALEFRKQHPAMFAKLPDFMALLQDREKLEELAKDPRAAAEKIYVYGRQVSQKQKEEFGKELPEYADAVYIIRPPSLLDIHPLGELMEDSSVNDVFVVCCPVGEPEEVTGGAMDNPLGVYGDVMNYPLGVYVDGEWRILCIPWGGGKGGH